MSEDRLVVGLIGLGPWGKNMMRVLAAQCDVRACSNKSDVEAHAWVHRRYPGVRTTFDHHELLNDPSIEAVVIATPPETHASLGLEALTRGKHVFVEKPLATSALEAHELVSAAEDKGLVLFTGLIFLYHPVLSRLRDLLAEDGIAAARMTWSKFGTFHEDLVWNLLCHDVAIALDLFGAALDKVEVDFSWGFITKTDSVGARLGFSSGRQCLLAVDRGSLITSKQVSVVTTHGRRYLWKDQVLYEGHGERLEELYRSVEEPLALEVGAFLEAVRSGMNRRSEMELQVVETTERLRALA